MIDPEPALTVTESGADGAPVVAPCEIGAKKIEVSNPIMKVRQTPKFTIFFCGVEKGLPNLEVRLFGTW